MSTGYSRRLLLKKLGIKADSKVAFVNAPPHYQDLLDPLPEHVQVRSKDKHHQKDKPD